MKNSIIIILLLFSFILKVRAKEVSIVVNGCTIKGTLEIPATNKPSGVALIIAGSGPTDRDGNNPLGVKCDSYKMLADTLLQNGFASLRYDKRGIGESDRVNESELSFDTYVNDAVEWIDYLKKDRHFSKIFLIGHSEGSLIGMIAAERTDVSKFISLCGAGRPAYSMIDEQLKNSNLSKELLNKSNVIMDSLKLGITIKNVDPSLYMLFRPSVQPYMISWFKYDPAKEISKLSIPVLIIGGTTDIQVDVKDAELLSKANKNSELTIINNMNHILKEVPTRDKSVNAQSYSNPDLPLSAELCTRIINFFNN